MSQTIVPLQPVPNQTTQIVLNNQSCQIDVFQTPLGLFFNLTVNDDDVVFGRLCQNLNPIIRRPYLGFIGEFEFQDTQGISDPVYTGLGSRYQLVYFA